MNKLTLPMPPTVNTYWRKGKYGQIYLSDKAKDYKNKVFWAVKQQKPKTYTNGERLKVRITLHFATKAKNDVDNRIKGLFDALTYAGVWGDDSQIDVMIVERGKVIKGGKVFIEIDEIEAGADK